MMGLIGQVWTRGMPVELTGTNSPKAYTFMTEFVCCLRPLYGFEITTQGLNQRGVLELTL